MLRSIPTRDAHLPSRRKRAGRVAALLLPLAAVLAPMLPTSVAAQEQTPAAAARIGRERVSFNADWRFTLGDVAGAERPDFDDGAWRPTGLPHSFSMPYFQASSFYTGYGWYRKSFDLPRGADGRRLSLEFEGAFQDAEIFVNGVRVGRHRGGYTGFPVDISAAVKPGRNVVAVRVNNNWDATLSPLAGEHVFSGGIYRDVWLVATDPVHVPWTGTRVTTPGVSAAASRVAVETEVRNDRADAVSARVRSWVVDATGRRVATLPDKVVALAPGQTAVAAQQSASIARPKLWSPESPTLYHVVTSILVDGRERDRFDTPFGFRWFKWTADRGFFLNGTHRYFKGANVHQDQAGWGDAVTNGAIDRDLAMMKTAGFDFIRGSHYPHDPHFAETTDRLGLLFLSEVAFWGTGGPHRADMPWSGSAYPLDPKDWAAFDASAKQQLTEMIRIHRNHPSIVVWGMDNEVFFSGAEVMPQVRRLLKEMVALSHRLDPTRPASIDGAQRGDIDKLGDVVGYNGDGAYLFPKPGIPSFAAEYGSGGNHTSYAPDYLELGQTPGATPDNPESWRQPWRSGEVIWAGFDHGSIAGRDFGSLGLVDYYRLPKKGYYWYRNAYGKVPPPAWPMPGTPAALRLTSSPPTIRSADGTDDVQLIVTVVDAAGTPVSNSPPVRLSIEAGPGELPTGSTIDFSAKGDITIRDGQAAIAMRSWQSGVSRIRATSPGLADAVLEVRTLTGPPFVPGVTPVAADRPYVRFGGVVQDQPEGEFGRDNPTAASSAAPGHASRLANDGDTATAWQPATGDADPWLVIDPERILEYRRIHLVFPDAAPYGFVAEVRGIDGNWQTVAEQAIGSDRSAVRDVETERVIGKQLRITLRVPPGSAAGLSEVLIKGQLQNQ